MAEEQKTVEVPQETKPELTTPAVADVPAEAPAAETKPVEEAPAAAAETAPAAEETPAETAAEEAPKAEEKEEEVKPIEEGYLSHKAQGLSFPKNLIPTKEFFFFGTDAVEPKTLAHYQKTEKSTETAHNNVAWASETGRGLLFLGDKKAPTGVISLADATEPEVDGSHKFHFASKGNKHTFKAASTAERDNWVSQLKLKIAEAKELAATVTESETYKKTIESFSPAKKEEAPKEETPKTEEAAPATPAVVAPTEEAPKEEEERKKEEVRSEEPKRRSASRKRTSFFGFGKKEEKKEESKEDKPAEETPAVPETPVAETAAEAPVAETEAPKPEDAPAADAAATEEAKPAEDKPVESPKPLPTKRNSFFGSVFSKKEKKTPELKPTEPEATKEGETAEAAPVIPPVEATTPLAVDVSSPATVPAETTEAAASTNGEPKKDVKEKRKSSLPFAFGKRDKSPAPADGEERSKSPFSKLRATIKGKNKADKPAEDATKEETVKEEEAAKDEAKTEETPAEAAKEEEAKPAESEEPKPDNVAAAPAVTAAA